MLDTIIEVYELRNPDTRHIHIKLRTEIEDGVRQLVDSFQDLTVPFPQSFRLVILPLKNVGERSRSGEDSKGLSNYHEWERIRNRANEKIERELGDDANAIIAAEKYGFIPRGSCGNTANGKTETENSTKNN